jgi:hypothetical protein
MIVQVDATVTDSDRSHGIRYRATSICFSFFCAVIVCGWGFSSTNAAQTVVQDMDISPRNDDANTHPYLEERLELLFKFVPELKGLQPAPDQQGLPMIMENTGLRVDDFTRNMVDLIARERGTQEARNWNQLINIQPIEPEVPKPLWLPARWMSTSKKSVPIFKQEDLDFE